MKQELEAIKAERQKVYGDPAKNHDLIAAAWAGLLQPWWRRIAAGVPVPRHVVALLMAAVKINRMRLAFSKDNYDDLAVYAGDFAKEWQAQYDAETRPTDPYPPNETFPAHVAVGANPFEEQLREFQIRFDGSLPSHPCVARDNLRDLRITLIAEESAELIEALMDGDLKKIAREAVDLIYVVIGTTLCYGIKLTPIFNIIHAANMKKDPKLRRADGKGLKPADWVDPDILVERALNEQCA